MADVSKIKLPDSSEYNIKDYRIPGVDTVPTSGSDNIITSGGVYEDINSKSLVISTALNDLNDRLLEVETSASGSVSSSEYEEDQEVIARAINDLNERIESSVQTFDTTPTENSTNPVTSGGIYNALIQNELVTASSINDVNDRLTVLDDYASAALNEKQNLLISGTNIKTINNESLLGSGNITITSDTGKGIESVTTTQNGDVIITLENGDAITIDLTHTHTNYLKYQYCTSEAEYTAIQNKDSNTLYLISEI